MRPNFIRNFVIAAVISAAIVLVFGLGGNGPTAPTNTAPRAVVPVAAPAAPAFTEREIEAWSWQDWRSMDPLVKQRIVDRLVQLPPRELHQLLTEAGASNEEIMVIMSLAPVIRRGKQRR
jgi:hypothetical protein